MPKSDCWFRPGTSGNPGGRPKNHGEIRQHARLYAGRAIYSLVQQATGSHIPARDRRQACRMLLRIGFGARSTIGDGILRDLGWHRVRQELAEAAQRDTRENGQPVKRSLTGITSLGITT